MTIALEMNAQLLTTEQIISVTQDGSLRNVKISPDAIQRGWMVYSAGSKHLSEKQDRINQLMMATQIVEQRSASGLPSPVREAELYALLMKEILGDISPSLVMSQQEFQELMEQHEQKQIEAQIREAELNARTGSQNEAGQGQVFNAAGGGPRVA